MSAFDEAVDIAIRAWCDEYNRIEGGDFYHASDAENWPAWTAALKAIPPNVLVQLAIECGGLRRVGIAHDEPIDIWDEPWEDHAHPPNLLLDDVPLYRVVEP